MAQRLADVVHGDLLGAGNAGMAVAEAFCGISESKKRIRYTVDFVEVAASLTGVGKYLIHMVEWDSFFLNEDHYANSLVVV